MAESVTFVGANMKINAPPGLELEMPPIFAFSNGNAIVTCWKPSDEELLRIVRTGHIYVAVLAKDSIQPMFVGDDRSARDVVSAHGKTIPQQPKVSHDLPG